MLASRTLFRCGSLLPLLLGTARSQTVTINVDATPALKWGSTNVYSEANGQPVYDWKLLDGGCFYPPTDYSKWSALVRARP